MRRIKPSKCEKHQNWKYIHFCPVCKMETKISDLTLKLAERDATIKALVETLTYYADENGGERVVNVCEPNCHCARMCVVGNGFVAREVLKKFKRSRE